MRCISWINLYAWVEGNIVQPETLFANCYVDTDSSREKIHFIKNVLYLEAINVHSCLNIPYEGRCLRKTALHGVIVLSGCAETYTFVDKSLYTEIYFTLTVLFLFAFTLCIYNKYFLLIIVFEAFYFYFKRV